MYLVGDGAVRHQPVLMASAGVGQSSGAKAKYGSNRVLMASAGVGQSSGAKAKFGSNRGFVEGCLGKGVGVEKCEDLRDQIGVAGTVMAD